MLNYIIALIILASLPVGYLLAWLCKDEIVALRLWILTLTLASFIVGSIFYLKDVNYIAFSCFFITVASAVSYWKSFDKKFARV